MQATPATAKVKAGYWKPWITIAVASAASPEAASAKTCLGSRPINEASGASTADTPHAITRSRIVCWFEAWKIGSSRYSTVVATTGHTACTMAEAAGGAVVAVDVTHECSGHSASRPATPTNSSTEATTSCRTVQPAVVCRMGTRSARFCLPYLE